jgi:hypothetical protein
MMTVLRAPVGHGLPDRLLTRAVPAHRVPSTVRNRTGQEARVHPLIGPVLIVPVTIALPGPASTSRAMIVPVRKARVPTAQPLPVRSAAKVDWNVASPPAAECRVPVALAPTTSPASPAAENLTAAPTPVPVSARGPVAAADRQVVALRSLARKARTPVHVRRGPSPRARKVRRTSVRPPGRIQTPPPVLIARVQGPGSPGLPAVHGPVVSPSPVAGSRAARVLPAVVLAELPAARSATNKNASPKRPYRAIGGAVLRIFLIQTHP